MTCVDREHTSDTATYITGWCEQIVQTGGTTADEYSKFGATIVDKCNRLVIPTVKNIKQIDKIVLKCNRLMTQPWTGVANKTSCYLFRHMHTYHCVGVTPVQSKPSGRHVIDHACLPTCDLSPMFHFSNCQ